MTSTIPQFPNQPVTPTICPRCGVRTQKTDLCPYDDAARSVTTLCWCCDRCRKECADEI